MSSWVASTNLSAGSSGDLATLSSTGTLAVISMDQIPSSLPPGAMAWSNAFAVAAMMAGVAAVAWAWAWATVHAPPETPKSFCAHNIENGSYCMSCQWPDYLKTGKRDRG